jgi:hypothetical protein
MKSKQFLITRDFLDAPERFFKHLFGIADGDDNDGTWPSWMTKLRS